MARTSLSTLSGAFMVTLALISAAPAFAEGVGVRGMGAGYSSFDAPLGEATTLQIELRGQVVSRCDLVTRLANLENFELNRAGTAQGQFAIDCNSPFILRVNSEHGGFRGDLDVPGVEVLAPYEIAVQVGTDEGLKNLGWCDARALKTASSEGQCNYAQAAPGGGWSSGDAVSINEKGTVTLRWLEAKGGYARSGSYKDTIVIELAIRS